MRELGMTGAPGLAKGTRKGGKGSRRTTSRMPNRNIRMLRVAAIYVVFGAAFIGSAYVTARSVLDERERHRTEVELRRLEEKRQGRVVYAQKDGHCRMARFDNASGRLGNNVTQPCDAPMKDPVAAARDFNWGNR
jgi:hypothetical protein